jgi:hypothetical protein
MVPRAAPLRQAYSINANNPQFLSSAHSLRPTLEMPENSIAARHDAKPGEQAARRFATSTVAHPCKDIGDGVALMRVGRRDRTAVPQRSSACWPALRNAIS